MGDETWFLDRRYTGRCSCWRGSRRRRFLVQPTVADLANTLQAILGGETPATNPVERAQQYDWNAVVDQAEAAYQAAIDGTW